MRAIRFATLGGLLPMAIQAQSDWLVYGHDPGGMRYSPPAQITAGNVKDLRRTGEEGRHFESTPLVAGNAMYVSTQLGRIVALAPGERLADLELRP